MCPFLEKADPRCAAHHSLSKLEEALGRCVDGYEDCSVYREKLLGDAPRRRQVAGRLRAAG
ncbi:MAG: hypothetical protein AMJ81_10605 [Phycisphaerae bacterium SM23_33]|nr:MAG: hypothetical protein AMJ81_10605 [Phycisphaerae bacterium SM23_33]